jgi:hypothetical protein
MRAQGERGGKGLKGANGGKGAKGGNEGKGKGGFRREERSSSSSSSSQQSFRGDNNSQSGRSQPERSSIPSSASDRVNWLISKAAQWDLSKLVYEFGGPSKENWNLLTTTNNAKVLREVFKLLGRVDVREDVTTPVLYQHLATNEGLVAVTEYIDEGPISEEAVENACNDGRGGRRWLVAVEDAVSLLETLIVTFRLFSNSMSMALVNTCVISLKPRVDFLCPTPVVVDSVWEEDSGDRHLAAAIAALSPWSSSSLVDDRGVICGKAKHLRDRYATLCSLLKTAKAAEREKKMDAERKADEAERATSDARANARQGSRFMTDPLHDRDYLAMSAIPTPERLLSSAASRLPQNLVVPAVNKRPLPQNENEEEDYLDEISHAYKPTPGVPSQFQYRNVDHYLNTHFQLLSEDCLAELKRCIAEFRERLCPSGTIY